MTLVLAVSLICLVCVAVALGVAWRRNRELVAELERARQRQQSDELQLSERSALDSLKDEFVSNVSHELRTPLTSIRGALGLLSSGVMGTVEPKAGNLLRIALTNTERLIRLINDVLDLERMESGLSVLQVRRCSLTDLISHATETMAAMAEAAEVKIALPSATRALLPSVFFDGDSDRIIQVLTNLLSNAIKFSPVGSTVMIDVQTPPDALIFKIVDAGRGIPDEMLESIFDRFKQVEHGDAQKRGGTGLGLAICRSIIEQHSGTIWAQKNATRGVSMCVRLPRLQRTYDATITNLSGIDSAGEGPILICDDNQANRSSVAGQLRMSGRTVLEASSGDEAILLAGDLPVESPIEAILVDLHTSDMRGWELLKALKRSPTTANLPIVVMSVEGKLEAAGREDGLQGSSLMSEAHLFEDLGRALDSERGPGCVLLVEDDEDLASVVLKGFEMTGVTVRHAASLQAAMTICREQRPDLMILDLTLPDGDGFAMVEWLRGRSELRALPLVVYSGREVSEEERKKLRLGPTTFLTKAKVQAHDMELLVLTMVRPGYLQQVMPGNEQYGR